jgi:hypothetical protein
VDLSVDAYKRLWLGAAGEATQASLRNLAIADLCREVILADNPCDPEPSHNAECYHWHPVCLARRILEVTELDITIPQGNEGSTNDTGRNEPTH